VAGRLSFTPWAGHAAATVEAAIGRPLAEFKAYRTMAERAGSRAGAAKNKKLEKLVDGLAVKLKELDIDRVFVDAAMAEIHRLNGAAKLGRPIEGLGFSPTTRLSGSSWTAFP